MALTVVFDYPRAKRIGRHWGVISGNIAFDAAYNSGGEPIVSGNAAIDANNCISTKFRSCKNIVCTPKNGYHFEYDTTNNKLKVMVPVSAEEGNTAAGANNTVVSANDQLEVAGTGTAVQVTHTEIAALANLATLTDVRFRAYGTI